MKLEIYKRGQGKYTRLGSGFGWAIIAALGCVALYRQLNAIDFASSKIELWVSTMVPVAVFAIFAILIFWLVNKPTIANFMIDAEGEMKKVSWSSRHEIFVSTVVVISVVVIMAAFLGAADLLFAMFFTDVIGL
ncbi:MAG: preprotein translocase subunit SecE [Phycisphaerae bacterium]|jgi:preprotein translocase subunit SecE